MLSKIIKSIVIMLGLCGNTTQAQFVYFDSLYDSGLNINEGINSEGVVEYQSGIYSVISYSTNPFTSGQLYYFETDGDGKRTTEFLIENDISGKHYADNLIILSDSLAIAASYFIDTTDQKQQCLTQFNRQTGELIWRKYYGVPPQRNYSTFFIKTFDGGYALTGQSVDSTNGQIPLIKTDNLGNQVWVNYYGGASYEGAYSLIQTSDTGYLLFGFTESFGAGQQDFYLVKTDSLGNQQWHKTYGSPGIDVGWGITSLQDGNYLLTGASGDGSGNTNGVIRKINSAGDLIWFKNYTYQNQFGNNLFWTKELNDGSLISVGMTHDNNDAGFVLKSDSYGNIIWQRKYNKNNDTDLFYSIVTTNDGGFLLGGQVRNVTPFNQDAWLLKVDEYGCTYPDCTVGIDENDNTKVVADIYPNPASELLNIEFQDTENYLVTLSDINGKIVFTTTTDETLLTVNVSSFTTGVYVLQLVSKRSLVNKKIIIQH